MIPVNYLSQALLTVLLLGVIKSKHQSQEHPARITFTSSDAAGWTSFAQRSFDPLLAGLHKPTKNVDEQYFVSKLLGMMFVDKLVRKVPSSLAVINLATPGMCATDLDRARAGTLQGVLVRGVQSVVAYRSAVGARLVVDAAVRHGEETHGVFLGLGETRIRP
jgi:hypothetical protein